MEKSRANLVKDSAALSWHVSSGVWFTPLKAFVDLVLWVREWPSLSVASAVFAVFFQRLLQTPRSVVSSFPETFHSQALASMFCSSCWTHSRVCDHPNSHLKIPEHLSLTFTLSLQFLTSWMLWLFSVHMHVCSLCSAASRVTEHSRSFTENLVRVSLKQPFDYHRSAQWLSSYQPLLSYWLHGANYAR